MYGKACKQCDFNIYKQKYSKSNWYHDIVTIVNKR